MQYVGATGSIVEGGIHGALDPIKLNPFVKGLLEDAGTILANKIENEIDGNPYTSKDALGDFLDLQFGRLEDKFKDLNDLCNLIPVSVF